MTAPLALVDGRATVEDRRRFLRRLAEEVVAERDWDGPHDFALPVVEMVVPTVCAAVVAEPLVLFTDLVRAVSDYNAALFTPTGRESGELTIERRIGEQLEAIDTALDRLMGRAS